MAKIETEAMQTWSTKINSLNDEALDILSTLENNINELNNYWDGNSSNNFINATKTITTKSKDYHTNMKKMSDLLIETTNRMNNQ